MGGDGGVVATNRRYLRGAGVADHTGDYQRASSTEIAQAEKERLQQMMKTCAITGNSILKPNMVVVSCPYGRLYDKEAAIEALLKRASSESNQEDEVDIGWHVRGMKDLYPVHFHLDRDGQITCPITGIELNGLHPALLMVPKKSKRATKKNKEEKQPNVLSEKAIKEIGMESLQEEYGPIDRLVRLAPTIANGMFDQICQEWEDIQTKNDEEKKPKKKNKKKKRNEEQEESKSNPSSSSQVKKEKRTKIDTHVGDKLVNTARSNIATAVSSNSVFSSLFQSKREPISDKEKRDNLFVR